MDKPGVISGISNEFKKLRSDINKDLDDIIESVKNIKVF